MGTIRYCLFVTHYKFVNVVNEIVADCKDPREVVRLIIVLRTLAITIGRSKWHINNFIQSYTIRLHSNSNVRHVSILRLTNLNHLYYLLIQLVPPTIMHLHITNVTLTPRYKKTIKKKGEGGNRQLVFFFSFLFST